MQSVKKRWIILLGYFTVDETVFVVTTTTRFEHYEKGGPRERHVHFTFSAGTGGLAQDSIVDFSQDFQSDIRLSAFKQCQADIAKTGSLKQDDINRLLNFLEKAPTIAKIIKRRIYECLRKSGYKVSK